MSSHAPTISYRLTPAGTRINPGITTELNLVGVSGQPHPEDTQALLAAVTVYRPKSSGYLRVRGADAHPGTGAVVRFEAGRTTTQLVMVPRGWPACRLP